jgi:methyltransferase (TIGR00027 family)
MQEAKPSRTALRVAIRRAAHQVLDSPRVFDDPLALPIIGATTAEDPGSPALRAFLAVRSRYAEDELREAVEEGIRQYVILGAGLDTFAYRNPYAELRVFEVDYPATQAWKRDQLSASGIAIPSSVTFVPADFEHQTVGEALANAGFHNGAKTFFSWLGVVPYLTREAFTEALRYVASMPPGSAVVFDYATSRAAVDALAARVAAAGEPFQLFFEKQELSDLLHGMGFQHVEALGPREINARYFPGRADGLTVRLGHLVNARL